MKNTFKTTLAAVIATLTMSTAAFAGDQGHQAELGWSDNKTVAQNYKAATKSVETYCRIEASRTHERSQSFKRKFKANCAEQLMDSYVEQIDSEALSTYHAMIKSPVTETTQFAANR